MAAGRKWHMSFIGWESLPCFQSGKGFLAWGNTQNAREYETMQWNWETQRSLELAEVSEETSKRGYKARSLYWWRWVTGGSFKQINYMYRNTASVASGCLVKDRLNLWVEGKLGALGWIHMKESSEGKAGRINLEETELITWWWLGSGVERRKKSKMPLLFMIWDHRWTGRWWSKREDRRRTKWGKVR